MKRHLLLWAALAALVLALPAVAAEAFTAGPGWLEFPAGQGAAAGKHVVLLAGDEEYRSEESMPMLARILSERHGFKCTVLFSHDDGVINPNNGASLGKPEALDSADALVLGLRFRKWNDAALANWSEVDALTTALTSTGLSAAQRLAAIQARVDVDAFLTFWAAEGLVGHWDGYVDDQNNFWFYVDPADNLIRFIPWGTDDTFGRGNPLPNRNGDPVHAKAIVPRSMLATTGSQWSP